MTPRQRALRNSGWTYALLWALSRIVMWWTWSLAPSVDGDVTYYYVKLRALSQHGIGATMTEYPTPVVAGLGLLYALTRSQDAFTNLFVFTMVAVDGVLAWAIWHSKGPRFRRAAYFWLVFLLILAPLDLYRFDTLPAVFAGLALLWVARHPRVAGGLIALGAGMKLWPALLILSVAGPRRTRWRAIAGFIATGVVLAGGSVLWAGFARTISPLTWQGARGLQIESIPATPAMLMAAVKPSWYHIAISQFNAFEVNGPGVAILLKLASLLTAVGGLAILVMCFRLFRQRKPRIDGMALTMLFTVLIMILTNKTLSPQYIIWLGGPVAAYLALKPYDEARGWERSMTVLIVGTLALAGLTTLIFPWLYDYVRGEAASTSVKVGALLLAARNLLLVVATVWVGIRTWKVTARDHGLRAVADPSGRGASAVEMSRSSDPLLDSRAVTAKSR